MKTAIISRLFLGVLPLTFGILSAQADPQRFYNIDAPGPIADNNTTIFNFTINDPITVADLDLRLALTHEEPNSLTVRLQSPTGTTRTIFQGVGGPDGGRFEDTIFSDEASTQLSSVPTFPAPVVYRGSFRSEQTLSAFDGESAVGVWKLIVTDEFVTGTGSVYAGGAQGAGWAPVEGTTLMIEPVPEPATLALLGLAGGMWLVRRRKSVTAA